MPTPSRPRNPVARSPLLRKGGVHSPSKTGQRVRNRLNTHNAIEEWLDENDNDDTQQKQNGEQLLPVPLSITAQTHHPATSYLPQ